MFLLSLQSSGAVYSRKETGSIVSVFRKYPDVFIRSDEITKHFNFVGKNESIAQFEDIQNRVDHVNGLSTGFAMRAGA